MVLSTSMALDLDPDVDGEVCIDLYLESVVVVVVVVKVIVLVVEVSVLVVVVKVSEVVVIVFKVSLVGVRVAKFFKGSIGFNQERHYMNSAWCIKKSIGAKKSPLFRKGEG